MKRSRRLDPVAKVARQQERNAARQLGNTRQQVESQQKQLDQLIAYRQQYVQGFNLAAKDGFSALQMQDYKLFLSRLDSAIMQQQQLVAASLDNCEQSQVEWQNRHNHSKLINKLVNNRRQHENRQQDNREQREQDDRPQVLRNPDPTK